VVVQLQRAESYTSITSKCCQPWAIDLMWMLQGFFYEGLSYRQMIDFL